MCVALTLDDVGDHESSAGVVTDETTAGQIAFYLQGKQIPKDRERIKDTADRNRKECGREKSWKARR